MKHKLVGALLCIAMIATLAVDVKESQTRKRYRF